MDNRRGNKWEGTYTPSQVGAVLNSLGVRIAQQTPVNFLCYCPFHSNRDTPSFSIGHTNGSYICYNPACDAIGGLPDLVMKLTKRKPMEALRFIASKGGDQADVADLLEGLFQKESQELSDEGKQILAAAQERFWQHPEPQDYMRGRGFEDETLKFFGIGYSQKKNAILTPIHSYNGMPMGWQARLMHKKMFFFWENTNASTTLFNLYRARKHADWVILVEAPFDAMRIHQAGYPNVVAVCGGYLSNIQVDLLKRHFIRVVVMPDNDTKPIRHENCGVCWRKHKTNTCRGHLPGKEFAEGVESKLPNVDWTKKIVGFKDACDMQDDQIDEAITNAEPRWAFARV